MKTKLRRLALWFSIVAWMAVAMVTLGATFTALCGTGAACAYQVGDKFGYQTVEIIRQNFNDLQSRLTTVEGAYVTASSTTTFTNKTIACYTVTAGLQHCGGKVALTDAQTKALPTTPITLVAAPGSGKTLVLRGAALFSVNTAGAYTNVNATYSAVAIYWFGDFSVWASTPVIDDSTSSPALVNLKILLGAGGGGAGKYATNLVPYHDSPATTPNGWVVPPVTGSSIYENKALAIGADNNGSGNFTGGNAANTLTVHVEYWIVG